MKITVSGKAWHGAIEASGVPQEEGWPEPGWAYGGHQAVYCVDPATARLIATHLRDVGEGFSYCDDTETRAEGRACLRDAARIEQLLACVEPW